MAGMNGANDVGAVVSAMVRETEDVRRYAGKVRVDRSTFLSLVFYFDELRPVLNDLLTKGTILRQRPSPELKKLKDKVTSVVGIVMHCTKRSRVYLLLNTVKIVQDVQDAVQEVGHCLNLVPVLGLMSSISPELHNKLADLRTRMRASVFEPEPGNREVAADIRKGLSQHSDDKAYVSSVMMKILKQLEVPVSEAATIQEEIQKDLAAAEADRQDAVAQQLWELKRLLGQAQLESDTGRINMATSSSDRVLKQLSSQAPDSFKCRLTGHVMRDPVLLVEAGITYERSAIEDWFAKGHRTCPDTGQELKSLELVPNTGLRSAIEEDFECLNQKTLAVAVASLDSAQGEELNESLEVINVLTQDKKYAHHVVSIGGITPLVRLMSKLEVKQVRDHTLDILSKLAILNEATQISIMEVGALQPLLKICADDGTAAAPAVRLVNELANSAAARSGITDEMGVITLIKLLNGNSEGEVGEITATCLEKFWRDDSYVAVQMASAGMFKPLIALLGPGNDLDTRLLMADAVMTWGVNLASRVHLVECGVIPPLLDLLNNGPAEATVASARALEHLSHTEANRIAMAKGGVISGLVKARSRGNPEVKEAAAATLANLAMDDQDLDALDEDGAISRLVQTLRTSPVKSRDYAVRTLETMVRDSKTMRNYILQDDHAVQAVCEVLQAAGSQFATGSIRSACILLLSHLCHESAASAAMVTSPEVVKILSALLDRPIPADEREGVVLILATMAANGSMRAVVAKEENVVPALAKCLQGGSPGVKEAAFTALAKLADPSDLETQQQVARLGTIPIAIEYLRMGPDTMRLPAALLMGNLSLSTPIMLGKGNEKKLTKALSSFKFKVGGDKEKKAVDKRRPCRVHTGKCSLEGTYCIVEGEVLTILLQLLEKAEARVAEACMIAISSLLHDKDDMERVVDYLVKLDIIPLVSNLVGKGPTATDKAVWVLEKVFHFKKYRTTKYAQPAVSALGRFMTTATGSSRKTAADALMRLDILPRSSMTESM